MFKACFSVLSLVLVATAANGPGRAEAGQNNPSPMEVKSPKISMAFGPKLDLKALKIGTQQASFEGRSAYAMCGQPAEILSVTYEENLIRARLRNARAEGQLEIQGGEAIAIRFRAQAKPFSLCA